MQQVKNTNYPSNALGRFWMNVPLVIRSVVLGFGVTSTGVGIWVLLATYVPVPWSVLAMGAILTLYWKYFSGTWRPLNTQAFRRFSTRRTDLKRPVWIWGLMAAFFIFLFLNASWILTFRIVQFQPEVFKTARYLNDYPAWASWSVILMASLVAGICEEIGYRVYMQTPIEKKYGPVACSFERKLNSVTGVDNHFILTLAVVLLSFLLFVVAIRKLLKLEVRDGLIGQTGV